MQTAPREPGLLDYFGFLAGRLKLLVLVPLAVGLVTFAVAVSWPKIYISTAIVLVPQDAGMSAQQAAAVMMTEPILRAVDATQPDLDAIRRRVSAKVGREGLVQVDVAGATPSQAQKAAAALVQAWLKSTVPSDRERADLVARRNRAQIDLDNVQAAITSITKSMGGADRPASEGMLKLAVLSETADRFFTTLQQTNRRLEGLREDVIVQRASEPARPKNLSPVLLAIAGALVTLFVLLAALLVRYRLASLPDAS